LATPQKLHFRSIQEKKRKLHTVPLVVSTSFDKSSGILMKLFAAEDQIATRKLFISSNMLQGHCRYLDALMGLTSQGFNLSKVVFLIENSGCSVL